MWKPPLCFLGFEVEKKMFIMMIATVMIEYHDKNVFDSNANHNSYEVAGEEEENRCRKK